MNASENADPDLAPPDLSDPVIEAYKKHIDRTLLRENLKHTPHERAVRMQEAIDCIERIHAQRRKLKQN